MKRHLDLVLVVLVVSISILRGLFWIGVYPALKIADEPSHFDDIQYRAEHALRAPRAGDKVINPVLSPTASRELSTLWAATQHLWQAGFTTRRHAVPEERTLRDMASDPGSRVTNGQSSAIVYPGFAYTVATIPYLLFSRASVLVRVLAVRVASLAWGTLFAVCTFFAVRWTARDRSLALVGALFAIFQPLAAQQTVAVNNDAAVIALCALLFVGQLALLRRPADTPSRGWLILLGCVTALALDTKPQAWALVPGTMLLVLRALLASGRRRSTQVALAVGVASFIVMRVLVHLICDRMAPGIAAASVVAHPSIGPLGFAKFLWDLDDKFIDYLFSTGWGSFCWLDVHLSSAWQDDLHSAALVLWIACGIAAAIAWLFPDTRRFWDPGPVAFSFFTAATGFMVILFAEYYARTYFLAVRAVQGRALLVVLPAATAFFATVLGTIVPARLRTLLAAIVAIGIVLLAAGSLVTVVAYEYVG
ncbi:MAG: hypothetical protein ABI321_05475 [Polyangia bacterium]